MCTMRGVMRSAVVGVFYLFCLYHIVHTHRIYRTRHRRGASMHLISYWSGWGPWSECSRTCGGGVALQTRECLRRRHGEKVMSGNFQCVGLYKQYKLCNTKVCGDGDKDFRAEQCREHNNKPFMGKRYSWEPYHSDENPCELHCRAQGYRFFAKLADKVIDGTQCRLNSTQEICVDGMCKVVGCDGVLGSGLIKDKCGVCGGDNTACEVYSGDYTRGDLAVGYHKAFKIPKGAMYINITEMAKSRNYLALEDASGVKRINGDWRIDIPGNFTVGGTVFEYKRDARAKVGEQFLAMGPTTEDLYVVIIYQTSNPGIHYDWVIRKPVAEQDAAAEEPEPTTPVRQPTFSEDRPVTFNPIRASQLPERQGFSRQQNLAPGTTSNPKGNKRKGKKKGRGKKKGPKTTSKPKQPGTTSKPKPQATDNKQPVVPETTNNRQPVASGTTNSRQPVASGTTNNRQPVASGTTNSRQPIASETTNNRKPVASGTTNSRQPVASETANNRQPVVSGTTNNRQPEASGTTNTRNPVASGTTNNRKPVASETANNRQQEETRTSNNRQPVPEDTANNRQPVSSGTTNNQQSVSSGASTNKQPVVSNNRQEEETETANNRQSVSTVTTNSRQPVSTGTANSRRPVSTGTVNSRQPVSTGTVNSRQPESTGTANDRQQEETETTNNRQAIPSGATNNRQSVETGATNNRQTVPSSGATNSRQPVDSSNNRQRSGNPVRTSTPGSGGTPPRTRISTTTTFYNRQGVKHTSSLSQGQTGVAYVGEDTPEVDPNTRQEGTNTNTQSSVPKTTTEDANRNPVSSNREPEVSGGDPEPQEANADPPRGREPQAAILPQTVGQSDQARGTSQGSQRRPIFRNSQTPDQGSTFDRNPQNPSSFNPQNPRPGSQVFPRPGSPVNPRPGSPVNPRPGSPVNPRPGSPVNPRPGSPVNPRPGPGSPVNPRPGSPVNQRPDSPFRAGSSQQLETGGGVGQPSVVSPYTPGIFRPNYGSQQRYPLTQGATQSRTIPGGQTSGGGGHSPIPTGLNPGSLPGNQQQPPQGGQFDRQQPGQPYSGQPIARQPQPGQPISDQPINGQPLAGHPLARQPLPGQPIGGQQGGGQPRPGQSLGGQPFGGQPQVGGQPRPGQQLGGQNFGGQPQVGGQPRPQQPLGRQNFGGQPQVGGQPRPGQTFGGQGQNFGRQPQLNGQHQPLGGGQPFGGQQPVGGQVRPGQGGQTFGPQQPFNGQQRPGQPIGGQGTPLGGVPRQPLSRPPLGGQQPLIPRQPVPNQPIVPGQTPGVINPYAGHFRPPNTGTGSGTPGAGSQFGGRFPTQQGVGNGRGPVQGGFPTQQGVGNGRGPVQGGFPTQQGVGNGRGPVQGGFPTQQGVGNGRGPVQGGFPTQQGVGNGRGPVQGGFPTQQGVGNGRGPVQGGPITQYSSVGGTGLPDSVAAPDQSGRPSVLNPYTNVGAKLRENIRGKPETPSVSSSNPQTRYQPLTGPSAPVAGYDNQDPTQQQLPNVPVQGGSEGQGNRLFNRLQYMWFETGDTECSVTCGGGLQTKIVQCVQEGSFTPVEESLCDSHFRPNPIPRTCNQEPCPPEWDATEWGECSRTCGEGRQMRNIVCKQTYSQTLTARVDSDRCDPSTKPNNVQNCKIQSCAAWKAGEWEECSARCGEGRKTRPVKCVDERSEELAEELCAELPKPHTTDSCDMGPCVAKWFASDWSELCSSECDGGERTRDVVCATEGYSTILDDSECSSDQKPRDTKMCNNMPCGAKWVATMWGQCSSECGEGTQTREVLCVSSTDPYTILPAENCPMGDKPELTQSCVLKDCEGKWFKSDWSECSKTCGGGHRTRDAKCLDESLQPSTACAIDDRPEERQSCNIQQCSLATPPDDNCRDKFSYCPVVAQARLCAYSYYKESCCFSCFNR